MDSLQSELNVLFDDEEPVAKKSKGKKDKQPKQPKQPKPPKPPKVRTTPLLKCLVNNESKYHDKIETICRTLSTKGNIKIVVAYGNTGLFAYWFKHYCPDAEVVLNDTDNVVNKLDIGVIESCLKDVTIEHKDPLDYIANSEPNTYVVVNPRSFDIKVIEFLCNSNVNLIVCGSTKNKNTDYLHIYTTLLEKYTNIRYTNINYATECDYILFNELSE